MDGAVSIIAGKGSVYDFTPGASHDAPQIRELYSEDFSYTDGVGNTGRYTYRVPQLLADTEGAADINRAIDEEYTPIIRDIQECMSGGFSMTCLYIAWETYQYGDILSLVISCGWDADMNSYDVYLYDTASGQRLTTADLLTALHVDETAFLDAVRRTAAERFDTGYEQLGDDLPMYWRSAGRGRCPTRTSTWTCLPTLTGRGGSMRCCTSAPLPVRGPIRMC